MRWQVREALLTSALLQLPYIMPRSEKEERVDAVLKELVMLRMLKCPSDHPKRISESPLAMCGEN